MGKYDPLFRHLCTSPGDEPLTMTFEQIEALVGPLPTSATQHQAWWSNEVPGGTHVQSRAWLDAGREVESADRNRRQVRFSAARWRRGA